MGAALLIGAVLGSVSALNSACRDSGVPSDRPNAGEPTELQASARHTEPGREPPADHSADSLYHAGLIAASEGRIDLAIERFTAALELEERAEVLDARASARLVAGQVAAALADLEGAVRLAPDNPVYLSNRAQVYRRFGDTGQALADLDRALELDPDLVAARFNRGSLLASIGRLQDALTDFDRAIELDPDMAPPFYNRAVTREALGRVEEARADMERFITLADDSTWIARAQQLLAAWSRVPLAPAGP